MNATDAVNVIRLLRTNLESVPQTDPGAAILQAVIDHLSAEVRRLTKPVVDDGGPAFPWGEHGAHLGGMSLRDYFAAKALQAEIITSTSDATPESADAVIDAAARAGRTPMEQIAFNAYEWADAMLKARTE
jgi:hypothetical protein